MNTRLAFALALSGFAGLVYACGGGQPAALAPTDHPAEALGVDAAAPATSAASVAATPEAGMADEAAVSAATANSAGENPPAPPPPAPGPGEWETWSKEQRLSYMKAAVMPKMGAIFHDFDAKRFAEPRCTLCHSSAAKQGNFKMPNPELPKLDLSPAGFKKMHDKEPEMVDFMAHKVEPSVAELLGVPAYDPKTKKGFGCPDCHTLAHK